MKIVIDDKIPFIRGVFEPYADVVYLPGRETRAADVKDADAIITRTRTKCDAALLETSSVKVIATATIGFDHIDTAWCKAHGIAWFNAPGCNSWSVKQYVASALVSLAARRNLNLEGMTLGVVGVGNVGSKVAEAAGILGMKVLLCDPPRARKEGGDFVNLDRIIADSDIVTLHVPLTKEGEDATFHLIDRERLSRMRENQILINSSRGPVVDNKALKETLAAKRIKAAVLDVWEGEPDLDRDLSQMLDYSTPHVAGYSIEGKANGTDVAVREVSKVLDLPLKEWKTQVLPAPPQSLEFEIFCKGKTSQQILTEAIVHTYDIAEDSKVLMSALSDFERIRGDYPIRREPTAFTIQLHDCPTPVAAKLRQLGFGLK